MSIALLEVQTEDLECKSCELTEHRQDGSAMARSLVFQPMTVREPSG